jgi:chitodextrinase
MGFLATHWRSVAFAAVALAVLALGPASTGAAPTGLVGAFSFDAGSGSALADLSGNGNNGTISGATWTSGKTGGALRFDGVNDLVTVGDSATLDLLNGMTLEAWVRPTANSAWRTIMAKEESGNHVYGLFSSSETGRPAGILSIGSKWSQDIVRGPGALALSTWTHVATTYDGSSFRFYVNGSQVATMPLVGQVRTSNGPLRIGGNTVWAEWFQGQIDDLRIYNRALSASEVQNDMNTPVGGSIPSADTQAPSAPTGLAVSGQTQTSLTLSWNASTDNVGVTAYGAYRDGASVGTTSAATRSYSFAGLSCGTTFVLGVDAADAAGNRSARSLANAATSPCTAPPSPTTAVAAYSFDAGSGTALTDVSGKGNNGTISGATWTSAGKSGGALSFDGVNDLATIADSSSLDLANGMTLEAWVRPTATGSWRTVVTKEMTGNLVYGLFSDSNTAQAAGIVSVGPLQDIVRATSAPAMSSWTHLATTYDGANQRIYVNGALVASRPLTGSMANSTGPLQIGGNTVWAEWFQGQIDDLRIYNRSLSATELQNDMNTPVAPPPPGPPADTQAPSAPTGIAASGQTGTSVNLSWNASTDNVGVTGYSAYRNGAAMGSTSAATRSYSFTGLACGMTYTFAVDAYDAAANRSAKASLTASTAACPPPPPAAQCADGVDNDADGKVDLADPGCSSSSDTSESPDPTPPPSPTGTVAPGESWQAAYNAAPALGVIRVLAGMHPDVTLTGSKQVTFLGDEGAFVRSLDLSAPLRIENVDIDTGSTHGQFNGANPRVPGIVFKNVNISGDAPSIHVWSTDFVWDGGEFTNRQIRLCGLDSGVPFWLNNDRATIKNFTFHPWREDDPACMHGEDIRVQGGDDVTIQNVVFESPSDAGSGHILVTTTSASDPNKARRLRLEGNTFHPLIGSYAIQVSDNTLADGWVVKNNRWDQPPLLPSQIVQPNSVFCGNTGQVPASWATPCP